MNQNLSRANPALCRPALSLLAVTLVLAGCVNLAPGYQQPVAPIPSGFPATGLVANPSAASPAAVGWREFFLDERLRRVVALTLENNRDLRVAALNIERARAEYGIAQAAAVPSLQLGATGTRGRTSSTVTATSATSGRVTSQYSVALGLVSYELDLFGRVRNLGDAALESYFSVDETRRSTQITLVAEVASAWLTLESDGQRLQLAQDTLASQQKSFDLVQRSHALGAQSGIALAQAQTTVDTARLQAATYDSQVEQDRNALVLLVGGSVPDDLLPKPGLPAPAPVAQLLIPPADLPSSVLQQRPDVLAAEHLLRSSNADIGAARAAFFPRISLTGSAGTASSTLSGLFKNGSNTWSFSPSITLPIFDGGANRANLKVAEVQQQIQLATYEKTLQTAFREVADALSARRTLAERLAAQQSLVNASARSFELSQALFKSGGGAYLDVLDAQRSLFAAQQNLIDLKRVEQVNRLTLYKVLGGGWTESQAEGAKAGSGSAATGG